MPLTVPNHTSIINEKVAKVHEDIDKLIQELVDSIPLDRSPIELKIIIDRLSRFQAVLIRAETEAYLTKQDEVNKFNQRRLSDISNYNSPDHPMNREDIREEVRGGSRGDSRGDTRGSSRGLNTDRRTIRSKL